MLNFCSLYSGSSGNSLFVETENTKILIDAGLPGKKIDEALKQIGELRYDSEMKEDGITEILKFGIAFSGKKVCVRTE